MSIFSKTVLPTALAAGISLNAARLPEADSAQLKPASLTDTLAKPQEGPKIETWNRTSENPVFDQINRRSLSSVLGKSYGKLIETQDGFSLIKVDFTGASETVSSDEAGFRVYVYKKAGVLEKQDWKPSHVFAYDLDCNPISTNQSTVGSYIITRADVERALGARQNYFLTNAEMRVENLPNLLGKLIESPDGLSLLKFSDIKGTGEGRQYWQTTTGHSDQKPFYTVCVYDKAGALSKQSWEPTQIFHFNAKGDPIASGKESGKLTLENVDALINNKPL